MADDAHKATARKLLNLWESKRSATLDDVVTPAYRGHQEGDVGGRTKPRDLDQFRALLDGYHSAFSNSTVEITAQIGEGDLVATHWRLTATHTGDYQTESGTLPPTNRTVSWCGISLDHVSDDKIDESWVAWDKYGFYSTLGLVK